MSLARLRVRAVVVSDGRSERLPAVLAALAAQAARPDVVHVALPEGAERPVVPEGLEVDWHEHQGSYSGGVDRVLDGHPAYPHEYLWLLHDDTAPLEDALAILVATAKKRTAAAVVSPAQVGWDDVSRLVGLGVTTTSVGARRIDLVDDDDINQGQYDERDDVLAASLAAALVRRDVWEQLGGLEGAYRGFGDSLHFCRRAWRAGYDVVVAPTAKVRHAQQSLRGLDGRARRGRDASYGLRRTGEWLHALAWAPLWAVPLLLLWSFASAGTRAVLRVAQNESRMVGADLAVPWRLLVRLVWLPGLRGRIRRGSTRNRSAVRPFLVGLRGAISYVRAREMRAYDRWRAQSAPSDLVRVEIAEAGVRRRTALSLLVVVAVATSIALHGTWLTALVAGDQLVGGALGVTDVPLSRLWEQTWSGWSAEGFGAPILDGAFSALLLPAAALPGGLQVWIGLLLGLGVAIATLSAWFALGAATRSVWARALGALAYGLWPFHLQAISDGRIGPVIAHAMLPWLALGLARGAGWHRGEAVGDGEEFTAARQPSPSAAMGAAFSMAVVVVAAPALLPALVVLVLVAGAFAGRSRWRVWAAMVPALVVSGPALVAAWDLGFTSLDAWRIVLREAGPALASPAVEPWRLVLGLTDSARAVPGLPELPGSLAAGGVGLLIVVGAVAAALSGRAPRAVAGGLLAVALGVVTASAAQATVVMRPESVADQTNGFAGPGTSLLAAGLIGAGAAASFGLWHSGRGRGRAVLRAAASLGVVAAAGVLVAFVVVEAWPDREERGDVRGAPATVLPLVATLEQQLVTRQRVLLLSDTPDGVAFTVLEGDGSAPVTGGVAAPEVPTSDESPRADADLLAPAIATLAAAGAGASADLAAWGIGVVVAAPDSPLIESSLSQLAELRLIGASEFGTSFRVTPRRGSAVSRAWVQSEEARSPLASDSRSGSATVSVADPATLVISVPAEPSWRAYGDGAPLAAVADERGRAAFSVPAGVRRVAYEYVDSEHRAWWWASVVAVVWAMIGMVPLHDRRYLAVRR